MLIIEIQPLKLSCYNETNARLTFVTTLFYLANVSLQCEKHGFVSIESFGSICFV